MKPFFTAETSEHLIRILAFCLSTKAKLTFRSFVVMVKFVLKVLFIQKLAFSEGHAGVSTVALEISFVANFKCFMFFMAVDNASKAKSMWLNFFFKFCCLFVASLASKNRLKAVTFVVCANSRVLYRF